MIIRFILGFVWIFMSVCLTYIFFSIINGTWTDDVNIFMIVALDALIFYVYMSYLNITVSFFTRHVRLIDNNLLLKYWTLTIRPPFIKKVQCTIPVISITKINTELDKPGYLFLITVDKETFYQNHDDQLTPYESEKIEKYGIFSFYAFAFPELKKFLQQIVNESDHEIELDKNTAKYLKANKSYNA